MIINHPTKTGMKLRYSPIEGPENSVYIRGRTISHVIQLPEYWKELVNPATITVHLTPHGNTRVPSIKTIKDNKIYLRKSIIDDTMVIDCYYLIIAERKDVPSLKAEF